MTGEPTGHDEVLAGVADDEAGIDWLDLAAAALEEWRLLVLLPLLAAILAAGASFLVVPVFTARTTLLPPQQSPQSSALATLGSLASLAGSGSGLRSSGDLYAALLQSATVEERLVQQFDLVAVYEVKLSVDARRRLQKNTRVEVGKKDGLLSIEVDDNSPQRAAEIANAYVSELRRLTSQLALTEAQQRRMFFEGRLKGTRDDLTAAQRALQASGFSSGALRAEPRLAAESYARLKAEVTAAELRLLSLRNSFAEASQEVQRQVAQVSSLRSQLSRLEAQDTGAADTEYISRYREFKYQESLFELFSRQYELARTDEAREGALIQVVDTAAAPQKRSKPQRRLLVLGGFLAGCGIAVAILAIRRSWRRMASDPARAPQLTRIRAALGRR